MQRDPSPPEQRSAGPAPAGAPMVRIRPFEGGDAAAFRRLNEEWITRHFSLEEKDRIMLEDPLGQILRPGGHIFIATSDGSPIGCCCLLAMEAGAFELAKMAVSARYQGRGIGRRLLEETVAAARALGARRLYLETNARLLNAIHLYESVGFRHIPPDRVEPSPYARANVFMEMDL
jgi:N-acetylglutamate synthase-like GNAT family acetyltransferase